MPWGEMGEASKPSSGAKVQSVVGASCSCLWCLVVTQFQDFQGHQPPPDPIEEDHAAVFRGLADRLLRVLKPDVEVPLLP